MQERLTILARKLIEKQGLHPTELMDLMNNGLAEPIITHGRQPVRLQADDGTYLGGFILTEKGRKLLAK